VSTKVFEEVMNRRTKVKMKGEQRCESKKEKSLRCRGGRDRGRLS